MSGEDAQKRRIAFMGVSGILLVAMVVAVTVGINKNSNEGTDDNRVASTVRAVETICYPTDYKKECEESLLQDAEASHTTDPKQLVKIAFNATIAQIGQKLKETNLLEEVEKDPRAKLALDTCKQLMNFSIDEFTRSLDTIGQFNLNNLDDILGSLKVWLSGAITYQDTCLDGFENTTSEAGQKMKEMLTTSMHMSSNALAIVTQMADAVSDFNVTKLFGRRQLEDEQGLPSWIHHEHGAGIRRLFEKGAPNLKPNVTVALDGSGDFKSINEALKKVPLKNKKPFVIFIKEGVYHEYVEVPKNKTHVVFVGEGGKKTRITGNKNFKDGINTFRTATVAVQGDYFVAINMGFENSAGPHKHQAVALRVQSDKSIFYKCSMDGYQDTLYAHTMRQLYRDCTISGTIDFIFGDAVAVFQNCTLVVRKPLKNQQCIVTAQGRKERHETTGIVIQGGSIVADPEYHPVRFDNKAYLARPWKNFSRTVFMDTFIDDLIQPDGYLPWEGTVGHTGTRTCFYTEYHNYGPGSDKSKRVKWPGIVNINSKVARLFSPSKFFHGDDWIEATGIPYFPGVPEHHRHKKTLLTW